MKKRTIFICVFVLMSCRLFADPLESEVYLAIGGFNEENSIHSGGELSLIGVKEQFAIKGSLVLFFGEDERDRKDLFWGGSATGYYHFNTKYIDPYFGAGVFYGETSYCSDDAYYCREKVVLAAYPEVGINFSIEPFNLFAYVRHYYDTNNGEDQNTYGIHIGMKL